MKYCNMRTFGKACVVRQTCVGNEIKIEYKLWDIMFPLLLHPTISFIFSIRVYKSVEEKFK